MGLALSNKAIDKYFSFLKLFDVNSKKKLIEKLNNSISNENKPESDLKSLFGAWADNRDSDEIIKEIKNKEWKIQNFTKLLK